nr:hypothetical protein [Tanacetum cinerariifolium]
MSLREIKEKFIPVWKQIEDFVPMASKEEGERFNRKGLRLEQDSAKKIKTSEEVSGEDLKAMMQTRSYIFEAWTDKFKARTKFGSCTTLCTPTNKDLEILFQPMFDEYLEPPRVDRRVSPTPAVLVPINSASIPSSTAIN